MYQLKTFGTTGFQSQAFDSYNAAWLGFLLAQKEHSIDRVEMLQIDADMKVSIKLHEWKRHAAD